MILTYRTPKPCGINEKKKAQKDLSFQKSLQSRYLLVILVPSRMELKKAYDALDCSVSIIGIIFLHPFLTPNVNILYTRMVRRHLAAWSTSFGLVNITICKIIWQTFNAHLICILLVIYIYATFLLPLMTFRAKCKKYECYDSF